MNESISSHYLCNSFHILSLLHYLFLTFGRFPPEFNEDGAELLAMFMALASGAEELAIGATWGSNRQLITTIMINLEKLTTGNAKVKVNQGS